MIHSCLVCVYVCVDHLYRCKTSIRYFGALLFLLWFLMFWFLFHAGGHSISLGLCPTKLPVKWDIRLGQLDVPAPFFNFVNGNRLSQVPACRFVSFSSLWTKLHQNLPQSKDVENIPGTLFPTVVKPLYGFRNLIYC